MGLITGLKNIHLDQNKHKQNVMITVFNENELNKAVNSFERVCKNISKLAAFSNMCSDVQPFSI